MSGCDELRPPRAPRTARPRAAAGSAAPRRALWVRAERVRAHPFDDEYALTHWEHGAAGPTMQHRRRCPRSPWAAHLRRGGARRASHERGLQDELAARRGCTRCSAVRRAADRLSGRPRRVPEAGHDATRARARRGHLLLAQVERLGNELAGLPSAVRARGELRGKIGSSGAMSSSTALAARRGRLCLTSSGRSWHSSYAASAVVSDGRASTYDSSHTSGMVLGEEPRRWVSSRRSWRHVRTSPGALAPPSLCTLPYKGYM